MSNLSISSVIFLIRVKMSLEREKAQNVWSFFSWSFPVWRWSLRYLGIHEFCSAGLQFWLPFRTCCQMDY